MALIFWWAIPLVIVAAIIVAVIVATRWRKSDRANGVPVAHSRRLLRIERYRKAVTRLRMLVSLAILGALLLLTGATLAVARPAVNAGIDPNAVNRDIVLCFDVSGSMTQVDKSLTQQFKELAKSFRGERIGLTAFSGRAVQIFPLTDDYDFITDQLSDLEKKFGSDKSSNQDHTIAGTVSDRGASLIGDGLASCVQSFDRKEDNDRPRSIILATDNQVLGKQLFTITQAADLAKKRGIRVYGINPNASSGTPTENSDMRKACEITGGTYHEVSKYDTSYIKDIVRDVQKREGKRLDGMNTQQPIFQDQPAAPIIIALIGLILLLGVAWRFSL